MALSLNDLKKTKTHKNEPSFQDKERSLRPWETFDKLGTQTRTLAARDAVKKAREIVELNNSMVEKLRTGHVSAENISSLEERIEFKNQQFSFQDNDLDSAIHKINTRPKIVTFFKDMFGA